MGKNNGFTLEIVKNGEGHVTAILSREGDSCGYRIAGPKLWGGHTRIATLSISHNDMEIFIREYAPELGKEK